MNKVSALFLILAGSALSQGQYSSSGLPTLPNPVTVQSANFNANCNTPYETNSANVITATLPTIFAGCRMSFEPISGVSLTVSSASTNILQCGNTAVSSISIYPNQYIVFTTDGSKWYASCPSSNTTWKRVGIVNNPLFGDPTPQIQESTTLISTTPELLTNLTKVRLYNFSVGWWTNEKVCFGEAADDFSQPVRFPNCISGEGRSVLVKNPTNGKYSLWAVNESTSNLDVFEATTISALSQLASPTYASAISCGSNGYETAGSLGGVGAIYDTVHSLWRVIYSCQTSQPGSGNGWISWLATGVNPGALTKFQTAPVCGYGSNVSNPQIAECGTANLAYVGGSLIGYFGTGPTGTTPTPYAYRLVDRTGVGNAFVADANPTFSWQNITEGVNYNSGQAVNWMPSPSLSGTGTIMYYSAMLGQGVGTVVCTAAAENPQPFNTVLSEVTSDAPGSIGLCSPYGLSDTFQGGSAVAVTAHTSDSGHSWYQGFNNDSVGWTGLAQLNGSNGVIPSSGTTTGYYSSFKPATPNYTVQATCNVGSSGSAVCGIIARAALSQGVAVATLTGYTAQFVLGTGVQLEKFGTGSGQLGSTYTGVTSGSHTIALTLSGLTLTVYVDGISRITATDSSSSPITNPGVVGFYMNYSGGGSSIISAFSAQ